MSNAHTLTADTVKTEAYWAQQRAPRHINGSKMTAGQWLAQWLDDRGIDDDDVSETAWKRLSAAARKGWREAEKGL